MATSVIKNTVDRVIERNPVPANPVASVILPVKRGDRSILACLRFLAVQDLAEPYETIVVLVESDPLIEEVRAAFPAAFTMACGDHGAGGSRNRGIEAARGRFLVFTDADCLPRPDWLRLLVEAARQHPGSPIAGWTEPEDAGCVSQASELFERGMARPGRPIRIPGAWGSNLCVERQLLLKTRVCFVEDLFGAEDVALVAQLPPEHRQTLLIPDALVVHVHPLRFGPATRRMYRIGSGSGVVRHRYAASGAFLARQGWLIPLLPAARMLMLLKRILWLTPRRLKDYVTLFPLLCWFACAYTAGFAAGVRTARKIPEARP